MTYAILYIENGDFIADFDDEQEARVALHQFVSEQPAIQDRVGLLAFGDDGLPVGDILSARALEAQLA